MPLPASRSDSHTFHNSLRRSLLKRHCDTYKYDVRVKSHDSMMSMLIMGALAWDPLDMSK